MPTTVEIAALSDMGCVRSNNEDFYGYNHSRQVYVVCDGMGGMASGEVASQMAVTTFLQTVAASDPGLAPEAMLQAAVVAANSAVFLGGQAPEHRGMGTTLVAACVRDGKLYIANVGDSRAYLVQGHQCMQITVDHSYLNELVRTGVVSIEDAPKVDLKGMSSAITRAIGVAETVEPDFFAADFVPGSIVLLTSDGLTRYLEAKELGLLIGSSDMEATSRDLIELARSRGGADNITVMLLRAAATQG